MAAFCFSRLKREEIGAHKCYFGVSDALWQRTGEHVVKLMFDSETCRLAIKLDEIRVLPSKSEMRKRN